MSAPQQFYFVLLKNTLPLDLAGPLQVLLEARRAGQFIDIHYVSAEREQIIDGGLMLHQLDPLPSQLDANDVVILPGCNDAFATYDSSAGRVTQQWLNEQARYDPYILTICSGAVLAAKAGLINNKACTTHFALIERFRRTFRASKVADNRIFVQDGKLFSSAGISSGIDMTLHFVSLQFGEYIAARVAREMLVYFRRNGQDPQLSPWLRHRNHMHRALHQVQDLICSQVGCSHSLQTLASSVHLSVRQLSRLFKQTLGITPGEYVSSIKVAHAKALLSGSSIQIEAIAEACGYSSARHFRRIWNQYEPQSPSQYRQAHQQ
ncbi:transcriptional regulator [Pseudoalteromonas rubra]|uniref:Transcriptional regulator n=1 Tax=Pseudoalteromonas rubra TaxID=43658 RepID=A0A5S3WKB8_9GAMM|nr:helix-turn-helix domain-containing protein [Pseudoalteromonas rubra]TMP27613.1 transcriptional regulator [Pseudoalteromonas rubra]TMP28904.1 transcriptional regulator [Pseudoalteromonas rubra]